MPCVNLLDVTSQIDLSQFTSPLYDRMEKCVSWELRASEVCCIVVIYKYFSHYCLP